MGEETDVAYLIEEWSYSNNDYGDWDEWVDHDEGVFLDRTAAEARVAKLNAGVLEALNARLQAEHDQIERTRASQHKARLEAQERWDLQQRAEEASGIKLNFTLRPLVEAFSPEPFVPVTEIPAPKTWRSGPRHFGLKEIKINREEER